MENATTQVTLQVEDAITQVNGQITPQVENSTPQVNGQITPHVENGTPQVKTREDMYYIILNFCLEPHSRREIAEICGLKDLNNLTSLYLSPLLEKGFLRLTIPDKPRSSKQKYQTVVIRTEK